MTDQTAGAARRGDILGHPPGLWVLAGTEFWDRISFAGMQTMLVLYMTGDLLPDAQRTSRVFGFAAYRSAVEALTGPLSNTAIATQTFGLYMALATGLPLVGGWLGDRLIGRKSAVGAGALLMTSGHLALAFDRLFLLALVLLVAGAGLLRGNLSAQIKALYAAGDRREAAAFQYYYVAVNTGLFVAPLVSGTVAAIWGWHAGFAVAGLGMLVGLVVYLAGARLLPDQAPRTPSATRESRVAAPGDRRKVVGLLCVWPFIALFWATQAQIWNVYSLWVRDHVDLEVGSLTVPVPWFQSLDGLTGVIFVPLVLAIWRWQAARGTEPDPLGKIATGCLIFGASVVLLACGPLFGRPHGLAPIALPVAFHLSSAIGYLYAAPVSMALFASRAPASWRGTLIGINALAISTGSLISGRMGGLYEILPALRFWLLVAGICIAAGLALLAVAPRIRRLLGPETD